jgi:hypothetical protein
LGFSSHSLAIRIRSSSSLTLVKYWSSRSRSRAGRPRCRSFAWPATASRMLRPPSSFCNCDSTSAGEPWTNIRRNTSDAFSSQGIKTPDPVHERLRAPCFTFTPSVRDGNRVRVPIRSAMYWSSEIVFRKPPLDG